MVPRLVTAFLVLTALVMDGWGSVGVSVVVDAFVVVAPTKPSLQYPTTTTTKSRPTGTHSTTTTTTTTTSALSMFTGIVEEMGTVVSLKERNDMTLWDGSKGSGKELTVHGKVVMDGAYLGCSICVNGVCLTATSLDFNTNTFKVGLAPETLRRTYFATLQPGQLVNLERASEIGGRNSGHFVQGHVDGTGTIINKRLDGDSLWIEVRVDDDGSMLRYIVPKGFIAIDGTSLTVVDVNPTQRTFTFMLVEYTQKKIIIPTKNVGEKVNLEVDVLGKYSEAALSTVLPRLEALEAKVESLERALLLATSSANANANTNANANVATSSATPSGSTTVPPSSGVRNNLGGRTSVATSRSSNVSTSSSSNISTGGGDGSFGAKNAAFVAGGTASPPPMSSWSTKTTADDVLQPRRPPAAASTVSTTNMAPFTSEPFETLEGRFNREVMRINFTPPVTAPSVIAPMMTPRRRDPPQQLEQGQEQDSQQPQNPPGTAAAASSDGGEENGNNGQPPAAVSSSSSDPKVGRSRRVILGPDTGRTGVGVEFRSILTDKGTDGRQGLPDPLL